MESCHEVGKEDSRAMEMIVQVVSQYNVGVEKKLNEGEDELVETGGKVGGEKENVELVGEVKEVDRQESGDPKRELASQGEWEVLRDLVKRGGEGGDMEDEGSDVG